MRVIRKIVFVVLMFNPMTRFMDAEIVLIKNEDYCLSFEPISRTSVISFENTVDLDRKSDGDASTYLAQFYSLDFNLSFKDDGPKFFLSFDRNGPWYYDPPIFIHNTLATSVGGVERYRDAELLPTLNQFWADVPLFQIPVRFKGGLLNHQFGHGLCLGTGYYENYGLALYHPAEDVGLGLYYFKPDWSHKNPLGPRIRQEEEQGFDYQSNAANLFAADANISVGSHQFQPYVGLLIDHTSQDKRDNGFATPTDEDLLGTLGIAWSLEWERWSFSAEVARNFGKAQSIDPSFKDVEHKGYLFYSNASYTRGKMTANARFVLGSGNKISLEAVEAGDEKFPGGSNHAFSLFSPLNYNLGDALNTSAEFSPLVAMGWGYGLNYGLNRPSSSFDPGLFDNLIMPSLGFDFEATDKLTLGLIWWYLRTMESGVGTLGGVARRLSSDLGHEIDLSVRYQFNDYVTLGLDSGYFFPGDFFKELRDDVEGSLFTPFVRGDGKADGAFQIEFILEVQF